MGNERSKGNTVVSVSQDQYTTGSHVSGLVYLHLTRRIRTDIMWLKLNCVEEVQWMGALGRMSSVKTNSLLRQKYPLGKWPQGEVKPGAYAFPFELELPEDLPGSFHVEMPGLKGSITYTIEAEIRGKKSIIRHCLPLTVHQSFPTTQALSYSEAVLSTSSRWWRHKGTARLRVTLPKTIFTTTEQFEATVDIDNSQGKIAICGVKGALFQTLRLRASGEQGGKSHISKVQLLTCETQAALLPGERLQGLPMAVDLSTISTLPSSTIGRIVDCQYTLEAELVLEGSGKCRGEEKCVVVALTLLAQAERRQELPPAPADWAPQLMPASLFPISQEFDYQPSAPPMEEDIAV